MQTIDTPAARSTDPSTSHDAAEQHTASGRRASAQQQVQWALHEHGQRGITSDELAIAAHLCRYATARRLPELRAAGLARVSGYPESPERRKSAISGKVAMVWRPMEKS